MDKSLPVWNFTFLIGEWKNERMWREWPCWSRTKRLSTMPARTRARSGTGRLVHTRSYIFFLDFNLFLNVATNLAGCEKWMNEFFSYRWQQPHDESGAGSVTWKDSAPSGTRSPVLSQWQRGVSLLGVLPRPGSTLRSEVRRMHLDSQPT